MPNDQRAVCNAQGISDRDPLCRDTDSHRQIVAGQDVLSIKEPRKRS